MLPGYPPQRSSPSPPLIRARTPSPTPTLHIPTPALLRSVAEASHYSSTIRRRSGEGRRTASLGPSIEDSRLSPERARIVEDVNELFCLRPTLEIFERSWNPEAIYEDPLSKCLGFQQYASQWFLLPKLVQKIETPFYCVLSSTTVPPRIVCSRRQEYTLRYIGLKKVIDSILIIDLDEDGKIIKLENKWNGLDQPTRWGAEMLRRLNAKIIGWFIRAHN